MKKAFHTYLMNEQGVEWRCMGDCGGLEGGGWDLDLEGSLWALREGAQMFLLLVMESY